MENNEQPIICEDVLLNHVVVVIIVSRNTRTKWTDIHEFVMKLYVIMYMCVIMHVYITKFGTIRYM